MKKNLMYTIQFRIMLFSFLLLVGGLSIQQVNAQNNVLKGVLPTVDVPTFRGDIIYVTDEITFDTITDKNDYQNIKRWVGNVKPPINIDFSFPTTTVYSADIYTGWYEGYLAGAANGGPCKDFSLQTFDGFDWTSIPGASISGNTALHVHFNFSAPVATDQIRLNITRGDDSGTTIYSRVSEVMVWNAPTAIKTAKADNIISFYPNPVKDLLSINLANSISGTVVEILNLTGQVLKKQFVDGNKLVKIDLSNLSKGVYICRYNNGSDISSVKFAKD
jgi:hypothetical protein